GVHLLVACHRLTLELARLADLHHPDAIRYEADLVRELRVQHELAVLSMHGYEVPRTDRVEHLPELLALRVTGDVYAAHLRIENPRAVPLEAVDGLVHRALVAG